MATPVEEALRAGYSQDEINSYIASKSQAAREAGYSDEQINAYIKENITQTPDFNKTPIASTGNRTLSTRPAPTNLMEAIETGWQWSTLALGAEALKGGGSLPSKQINDDTPWYLRAAANLTQTAADVPAMIAGGVIGGETPVTALAGAFAMPMGLRKVFIDAIESGQVGTNKEFADRVIGTMWETAKGWITGGVTGKVGAVAKEAVSALPGAAKAILPTAAELATMTTVSSALEGQTPTPQALMDNAIVLGVAKAVVPRDAKPIGNIYVKTGVRPEQLAHDAVKDSSVWQDVLDGRIPDAYKDRVETTPQAETQAQRSDFLHQKKESVDTDSGLKTQDLPDYAQRVIRGDDKRRVAEKLPIAELSDARWKQETVEIESLKHNNPFQFKGLESVKPSSKTTGPIVLDRDGLVIDGNHRLMEAAARGDTHIDVYRPLEHSEKKPDSLNPAQLDPEQQAKARAFMEQPFAEIPQMPNEPSRPTHINYNYVQTTEETAQALSRLSEIYEDKIQDARKGQRSWEQSHQEAAAVLGDLLNSDAATVSKFLKGEKADASTTAQLLARKELTLGFTEDLMRSRAALEAKGDAATPEEIANFLAQVERVSQVQASFLGQRADVGRALNALKSTKREADRSQAIIDAINSYGGPEHVGTLVKMLGEYDNPAQAIKFAKEATKATTWEMVVEAWKAGLVSGLRTHEVNVLSTLAFSTLRLPTEAIAATYGALRRGEDRVRFSEIPARLIGMGMGVRDGITEAAAILRTGEGSTGPKVDADAPKIPGKIGEVVRLPFRALSAEDAVMKGLNERSELYALAVRKAMEEGQAFGSEAFMGRVHDLVNHPTDAMAEQAKEAAFRYTFNKPLGDGGKAFQRVVKEWHLQWMFPFITTPGNIFKETARMTPGANLAVKQWREDFAAGGARRDRALAEVSVGAAMMTAVFMAAMNGTITGNGTPDKRVRATDRAAGWKPYAVKINGQYVDGYLRMAPIGPLMGLTADAAEFWQYMTDGERDQWARMLAFAFANNVTNQTFMSGMTSMNNLLQDPGRYGQNYFESLAASVVPQVIGQTAADLDPLLRELHGMRDAMMARIPGQREGLLPKRDLFGEPIDAPERLWFGSPFTVSSPSDDKVRLEASRLGFATPDIPKSLDVIPGKRLGAVDKIQLTPEQRDIFATQSGRMAHDILSAMVNSEGWASQPDIAQRREFEMAFKKSRDAVDKMLLSTITEMQMQEALQALDKSMTKKAAPKVAK